MGTRMNAVEVAVEVAVDALEELQQFARGEIHRLHPILAAQIRHHAGALLRGLDRFTLLAMGGDKVVDREVFPSVMTWVGKDPDGRTLHVLRDGSVYWRDRPIGEYLDLGKLSLDEVEAFLARQPGKFHPRYFTEPTG